MLSSPTRALDRSGIDPDCFKAAMRQLASGVTIISMRAGDVDHGFTATSFTSVSLEPMLALVCVMRRHRGHELIERAGHFAVNLLTAEQKPLGIRFATSPDSDRFAGLEVERARTGAPVLLGTLAWLDCTLKHSYPAGDHTIFVGEAVAGAARGGHEALVYCNRQWGTFSS